MKDFIVRQVDGYGYLPIIQIDSKEVYRGEFQKAEIQAFIKCLDFNAKRLIEEKENE